MISRALNRKSGVRVLLAVEPRLLRDSLRNRIAAESDMEVVDEVFEEVDILLAMRQQGANVLIHSVPASTEPPAIYSHLFVEYPGLVIVGLQAGGQQAYVYRQEIVKTPVEACMGELFGAIRRTYEPLAAFRPWAEQTHPFF